MGEAYWCGKPEGKKDACKTHAYKTMVLKRNVKAIWCVRVHWTDVTQDRDK
jgi:hypothetical protein